MLRGTRRIAAIAMMGLVVAVAAIAVKTAERMVMREVVMIALRVRVRLPGPRC